MPPVAVNDLRAGATFALPPLSLSEDQIKRFARLVDPQPIHLSKSAAAKSPFGGIIASGLHPYTAFHREYWVEMVKDHFICGLEMNNARFFSPCYPDMLLEGTLTVEEVVPKPAKKTAVVRWRMDIRREEDGKAISSTVFTTYHYLPGGKPDQKA